MQYIKTFPKENYLIIQFDRGVANAMDIEFIDQLNGYLNTVRSDETKKGIIITGKDNFFSAGLDIKELFNYDKEKLAEFWSSFMELIYNMVSYPKPLIAAINGHSPAGGCILALACDYRFMADGSYRIGLNEIPVSIVVPQSIFKLYSFWLGERNAYQFLMEGKLCSPIEALEAGMIDKVVKQKEVLEKAEEKLKQYLAFDETTWIESKMNLRKDLIEAVKPKKESINKSMAHWWLSTTRDNLQFFLDKLTKK